MSEARSLRDELQAVHDELAADPVAAVETLAPELAEPPEGAAPPEAATEPKAETGERPRGPDGKFLPKTDPAPSGEGAPQQAAPPAPEPISSESAKPEGEGAQTAPTRVPPSLPAALKAKFGSLDPDVQQGFVALEDSVQKAKAEWEGKGQRLNRYDEIIGPHLDRWRVAGLDEYSGIQSLIAAQSMLDRDPLSGIAQIARSYGLSPAHIAQAFGFSQTSAPQSGQEGHVAPTANPDFQAALQAAVAPLVSEVQTLKQGFTQTQQAAEAAQLQALTEQIDAFAAKPENMYFNDVMDEVVARVHMAKAAGKPATIDTVAEAYQAAIWASPTIRPLLIEAQAKEAAAAQARAAEEARKQAEHAARAKAQEAARSAGSVTGSPAPGSHSPGGGSTGNLREDLKAAWNQHAGV